MKRTTPYLLRPFTPLRLTHDTTPEQAANALLRAMLNRKPGHITESLQDAKFIDLHHKTP